MGEGLSVKQARAITWTEVGSREAALVHRCALGDEDACGELVDEHERMVYQLGLHLLGDHDEALDLSQEVFLRVFRTIHRFRGQSTLRTWIYRIAVNQCHNRRRFWRRRGRDRETPLEDGILAPAIAGERRPATPYDETLRLERARQVQAALLELRFEHRSVLVLREVEGLTCEEVAAALGVPEGTVKSRLSRAREAMRRKLARLIEGGVRP